MTKAPNLYRNLFLMGLGLVLGLAWVAALPSAAVSIRDIAAMLRQPAFEQDPALAGDLPGPAVPPPIALARIRATPAPPDVPGDAGPAEASEASGPGLTPEAQAPKVQAPDAPADNFGDSEGEDYPGMRFSGLSRGIASDLLGSGQAVLVVELLDDRQIYLVPGAERPFRDFHFEAWAEIAHAYSQWELGLDPETDIIPVPVLKRQLIAEYGPVGIGRLSLVLSADLDRTITQSQKAALEATRLDYAALSRSGQSVAIEGCWSRDDPPIRVSAVTVGADVHLIPGADPCS